MSTERTQPPPGILQLQGYRDTAIQGYREIRIQGNRETGKQGNRETGIRDTGIQDICNMLKLN